MTPSADDSSVLVAALPGHPRFRTLAIGIMLVLGVLLYGDTLSFPFVFDDHLYLVDNPLVKDWHSFTFQGDFTAFANYARQQGLDPDLSTNFILRPVTYLTFYLNYLLDGMQPRGFRAVNIAIHLANAILLFLLLGRILRTSAKRGALTPLSADFIAFSAALLFLAHPLQIESVTYCVQRFTSLGTLFYLGTVLTFLAANAAEERSSAARWRSASLACLIVGMLAKEILFTAPLLLVLLDHLVMGSPLKTAFRRGLPYCFCLPILPVLILFTSQAQNQGTASVAAAFNITNGAGYSQLHYALSELSVVLTYLRLVLLPTGQNIDWDYPLTTTLLSGTALVAAGVLAGILGGAALWYRHHGREVRHALLCLGVLWFFLTLAIDSSVVPLPDLLAEHRTYLPSIGLLGALACGADLVRTRPAGPRAVRVLVPALMLLWILALATATNLRHQDWRSELAIWKDAAAKSPQKFRPWFNLGPVYFEQGRPQEAIACMNRAIAIQPTAFVAYRNLGRVQNLLGRHREALVTLRMGVWLEPDDYEQHHEMGLAYAALGEMQLSRTELQRAIAIHPSYRPAHLMLGAVYAQQKQYGAALEQFSIANTLQPLNEQQRQVVADIQRRAQLAVAGTKP